MSQKYIVLALIYGYNWILKFLKDRSVACFKNYCDCDCEVLEVSSRNEFSTKLNKIESFFQKVEKFVLLSEIFLAE